MARLVLDNVSKLLAGPRRQTIAALRDLNLTVADGHSYTLTVDLQVPGGPAGQHNLAATTQEFWLQIAP